MITSLVLLNLLMVALSYLHERIELRMDRRLAAITYGVAVTALSWGIVLSIAWLLEHAP